VVHLIGKLCVFFDFDLHLGSLFLYPSKLFLKNIKMLLHLCFQINILLFRVLFFFGQFHFNIVHMYSLFYFAALNLFEEKRLAIVIRDEMKKSFLNSEISDILQIYQQLVKLVAQLHLFILCLESFSLSNLLIYFFLKLLKALVAVLPSIHIAFSKFITFAQIYLFSKVFDRFYI